MTLVDYVQSEHTVNCESCMSEFSPRLSTQIRDRFCNVECDPFLGDRIYFENAGGSLTLKSVVETSSFFDSLPDNAGRCHATSQHVNETITDGRAAVSTFLNAPEGEIASRDSATSMIFSLLDAATADADGGNVVCSNLDHAATYDAAAWVCEAKGLTRRVAHVDQASGVVPLSAVMDQIDEQTVAVAMVHASNVTGGVNDLAAIGAAVRERAPSAMFIADGTQFVQHGGADITQYHVDGYVFAAYKAFSRIGGGFAWISPRLATRRHPRLVGNPQTAWDLGTRDAGNYAAFRKVVEYLCWLGREAAAESKANGERVLLEAAMSAIVAHETQLGEHLLSGLARLRGVHVVGDVSLGPQRQPVFAIALDEFDTTAVVRALAECKVIIHERRHDAYTAHVLAALGVDSVLRVALAHYNTRAEVDRFLTEFSDIVAGQGVSDTGQAQRISR